MNKFDEAIELYVNQFMITNENQRKKIFQLRKNDILEAIKLNEITKQEFINEPLMGIRKFCKTKFIKVSNLINESKSKLENISYTKAYTCFKCKKKECSVKYMQTRSSDEPMTGFITCMNCGNKWKT